MEKRQRTVDFSDPAIAALKNYFGDEWQTELNILRKWLEYEKATPIREGSRSVWIYQNAQFIYKIKCDCATQVTPVTRIQVKNIVRKESLRQ
jgi:hypothetical protein